VSFRSTLRSALTRPAEGAPRAEATGITAVLRRPTALVLQALLLVALVAAALVWTSSARTVQLAVDGQARSVDLRGTTVADVLSAAHLTAGEHDTLVPSATSKVEDGDKVVLRRGRPLQLVVDGSPRTVWVTALSVDEALQQLDLRQEGLAVSASRSRPIPLAGMALDIRTPKGLTVAVDGKTLPITSAAATVQDALAQAGVQVGPQDRVTPAVATPVTAGLAVTVQRVRTEQVVEDVPVAFPVQQRPDATLATGTTKVVTPGQNGVAHRTTTVTWVDGAVESRVVASEQRTTEPVTQVVAVGTKAPAPAQAQAQTAPAPGPAIVGNAGGLNWGALANCESGGNPRAVSPGGAYRGLYQFSMSTWAGVGGSGDPINASPDEQTNRAQILYNRSGRGSWPVCGRYL
jgi:uncharacterized protein YabE (DUF348 family)